MIRMKALREQMEKSEVSVSGREDKACVAFQNKMDRPFLRARY